jgi:hypothetical protein
LLTGRVQDPLVWFNCLLSPSECIYTAKALARLEDKVPFFTLPIENSPLVGQGYTRLRPLHDIPHHSIEPHHEARDMVLDMQNKYPLATPDIQLQLREWIQEPKALFSELQWLTLFHHLSSSSLITRGKYGK